MKSAPSVSEVSFGFMVIVRLRRLEQNVGIRTFKASRQCYRSHFNPLKTKRRLLYLKDPVRTVQ